jgi:class 3 adenylate cyclase
VSDAPLTRYARARDGVRLAYQTVGDGPIDLVVCLGVVSHLEVVWEQPAWTQLIEQLAAFSRVILLDRRGIGLSDRRGGFPPWEVQMDDVGSVLEAVGSERAALLGSADAGAMFMLFAATYPERTRALVLFGAIARWTYAEDYPEGVAPQYIDAFARYIDERWGAGDDAYVVAPSRADDAGFRRWWGKYQRLATGPGDAAAFVDMCSRLDVRPAAAAVQAPTLVLHRAGDQFLRVDHGRHLAGIIPGARFVELPGDDHLLWVGDTTAIVEEVEELLTGSRGSASAARTDRVLATVLFTDIVGSTEHVSRTGDERWRRVIEEHDAITRQQIARHRGRLVHFTGDGALATFDGPARAIRCAAAIRDSVPRLGISVRAGVHTGEIELRGDDVGGIAVHIGQRVSAAADANQILVSRTVVDLVVGSTIAFDEAGDHELKGVPGRWSLFRVADPHTAGVSTY